MACLAEYPRAAAGGRSIDRGGSEAIGVDSGRWRASQPNKIIVSADRAAALRGADMAVDFSAAHASAELLADCVAAKVACLIGTTGQPAGFDAEVGECRSASIAVLQTANTSVGVGLLVELTAGGAESAGYDIEIVEAHHRQKQDAPSGTALALGRAAAAAASRISIPCAVRSATGWRRVTTMKSDLRWSAAATSSATTTSYLPGPGERVVLRHQATDRAIFARGALRAAAWLAGRPARPLQHARSTWFINKDLDDYC